MVGIQTDKEGEQARMLDLRRLSVMWYPGWDSGKSKRTLDKN